MSTSNVPKSQYVTGKGITIPKLAIFTDNQWHYFKLQYQERAWNPNTQRERAALWLDGWQCCEHDDSRRSVGDDLPHEL